MAGTCTASPNQNSIGTQTANKGEIPEIVWVWVSDAAGAVSGQGAQTGITGRIEQVRFIPATAPDQPTNPHSVYLLDAHGLDVLMGVGVGQSNDPTGSGTIRTPFNADNSYVYLSNATLTPLVSGAGNAKSGTIVLVVR